MSRSVRHSERGAIIIHVAIALLALTIFSAVVLDYGVVWASRAQAQNSADAGALSAALNMRDFPSGLTEARDAARKTANVNTVWGEAPAAVDVLVDLPITCPPGTGGGTGCVRVDVMRGGTDRNGGSHTNFLPVFFASLMGITSQQIQATATAQVSAGNSVQCIKPWAVADKWTDATGDTDVSPYFGDSWDRDDDFIPGTDTYTQTGFNPTFDTGYQMPLKPGSMGTWSSGWAAEIHFPGCTGGSCYQENIEGCPSWVPTVGIWNPTAYAAAHPGESCNANNDAQEPGMGCVNVQTGMMTGPTGHGVDTLVDQDSGATWIVGDNPATPEIERGYVNSPCMNAGNCHDVDGKPLTISARIVPIAIFDTGSFVNETCSGGGCMARVKNLGGYFIEGMCDEVYPVVATRPAFCGTPASEANKVVIGRFMKYPGQLSGSGGDTTSSFATAVRLVR